jgi:hypothetical protein
MQSSQPKEIKKDIKVVEEDLVDKDKDVFYHVLSFDPSELYQ